MPSPSKKERKAKKCIAIKEFKYSKDTISNRKNLPY